MAHFLRSYKYVRPSTSQKKKKKYQPTKQHSALLLRQPMLTQCTTAAVLFTAGDVLAQQAIEGKGKSHDVITAPFRPLLSINFQVPSSQGRQGSVSTEVNTSLPPPIPRDDKRSLPRRTLWARNDEMVPAPEPHSIPHAHQGPNIQGPYVLPSHMIEADAYDNQVWLDQAILTPGTYLLLCTT